MKTKTILLSMLLFAAFSFFAKAQPGAIDLTFNPTDQGFGFGDGANNNINATAIQSDGKILIAGSFTNYNGAASKYLCRLNTNGTRDTTFNMGDGPNSVVYAIAIQSDGKIIIGGAFTSYNGTSKNRIARLNTDGTLDALFNLGTGADNSVFTTSIQSDGKIIVGGYFTTYNGTTSNHIARLNADGSLDGTFTTGTGADNYVYTSSVQSDGKIIIGGEFTSYNGTASNYLCRLSANGTLDATFNTGTGPNNLVYAIAIQSDSKIIIGGEFNSYNGTSLGYLYRLSTDGSIDASFTTGTGANATVRSIAIQSDGKIIISGAFTTYNGVSRNMIARVNTNGNLDVSFDVGSGAEGNVIIDISIQSDGKVIAGGNFISYNNIGVKRLARINSDGSIDAAFTPSTGANSEVNNISMQNDGKIIIGGSFTSFNGIGKNRIARLNTDGSLDATFNVGTGTNKYIRASAIQSDGKIIIAGDFTSYNGTSKIRIARIDTNGSVDAAFNLGTGANVAIYSLSIQPDGKIIIGGDFNIYNGTATNYIARLNTDGTLDATFNTGTGANGTVYTTIIQSDGKIIIGGDFTTYNGIVRNRIARINADGTLDATFNPGTGANVWVYTTTIQADGKIIIGGAFSTYNGTAINCLARLNADGTLDASFNTGTGASSWVMIVAYQPDGKIIIGGDFSTFNGIARSRIARLNADGTLDGTFNPGTGANNNVMATAIQNNGKIIIGGNFTGYNGTGRNRVARILHCTNTSNSITVSACDNYTAPDGQIYTTSGIKTAIIPNASGCDSTISIDLTINTVDVSVTVNEVTITANASGANYQWVDCNNSYALIAGEENQSYTATANGTYAVIVTQGLCSDTSVCTQISSIGISSNQIEELLIYPNPVSDELIIEVKTDKERINFELLNSLGQVVYRETLTEKNIISTTHFEPGVYLIKLDKGKTLEFKIIIKN